MRLRILIGNTIGFWGRRKRRSTLKQNRRNWGQSIPILKSLKAITDEGSLPVVKLTFIHADTPAAIGNLIHCIHIAITCPLCRIIHLLGFTGMGIITVTRRTTAIIGDILHIGTSMGDITVEVDMYPYHGKLTIEGTGDLKIGVLEVHAV